MPRYKRKRDTPVYKPFKKQRRFKRRLRRGKNAVPRVLRSLVETKVYSQTVSDADISSSGHFMYLNALIDQGDTLAERDGRKITCTKAQLRMELYPNGVSTFLTDRFVRIVIFIDKTPNQESMALTDLIDPTYPTMSFRTWNESFRYKVLSDKRVRLPVQRQYDSLDVPKNSCGSQIVEYSIPLNMNTEWIGDTGGIGNITKNSLVALVVSDNSTAYVAMKGLVRVHFVDL